MADKGSQHGPTYKKLREDPYFPAWAKKVAAELDEQAPRDLVVTLGAVNALKALLQAAKHRLNEDARHQVVAENSEALSILGSYDRGETP